MTPSTAATLDRAASIALPRALVLRSCRPHVLTTALEALGHEWPSARLSALTHPGHRDQLREHGFEEVFEVPGKVFGPFRTPLKTLAALRAERFDVVLIPMMSGQIVLHLNLALLALVIGARRIAFYSTKHGLDERSRFATFVEVLRGWRTLLAYRLDVPMAVTLMALASIMPRRRRRDAAPARVLHVISSWGVGGAQRQLAELIQHCPVDRCSTELFVLAVDDGEFSSAHLRGHDVRIRYSTGWPRLTPTILELARLCRAERYDIVHTWLFLANALGVTAGRLAGTPRVISSVRNLSLWKRTWANQPWFRIADTLASRASDVVTVNGTSLVADHASWARMRPQDIAVIPNGLSLDGLDLDREAAAAALRDELGLRDTVRLVGTVGRLAPEKDHQLLLDAWIDAAIPDAHLVIAGDGALRAALQARIDDSRAAVTLLGESDHARAVIAGLDLFVLPSRIEGFPNVLLEATMLGVPVLATDVGAARDMVVDDDDLVPVGDAGALASRLITLLDSLEGPRRRAAIRRDYVRRTFTIDRMVERWLSLYSRS